MEVGVFPRPAVVNELKKFVRVEMVTDQQDEESTKKRMLQQERFGDVTLPLYIILDPDGEELDRLLGFEPNGFEEFLRLERARKAD